MSRERTHVSTTCETLLKEEADRRGIVISKLLDDALRRALSEIDPEFYNFSNGWEKKVKTQKAELLEMQLSQLRKELADNNDAEENSKVKAGERLEKDAVVVEEEKRFMTEHYSGKMKKKLELRDRFLEETRLRVLNAKLWRKLKPEEQEEKILEPALEAARAGARK